jgi:hypothetical protein
MPDPPGWYPDPRDAASSRYWDGTNWSERVAPRLSIPDPAAGGTPRPRVSATKVAVMGMLSLILCWTAVVPIWSIRLGLRYEDGYRTGDPEWPGRVAFRLGVIGLIICPLWWWVVLAPGMQQL